MKHISKTTSPLFFEKWKTNFRNTKGAEPNFRVDFKGAVKLQFKDNLMKEQNFLCCYCLKSIDERNSHIEHIKPLSNPMYTSQQMDYYNLVASCNGYSCTKENCGHIKDDWYETTLFISPLDSDCEDKFIYKSDGRIIEKNNNPAAKKTIEKLELNSYLLKQARKAAIDASGFYEDDFLDNFDFYYSMYETTINGKLPEFCVAVQYVMKAV